MKKQTTQQQTNNHAELARHIEAIMANPVTPVGLYNAIADQITDWSTAYLNEDARHAAYIEKSLIVFNRREAARRAGDE